MSVAALRRAVAKYGIDVVDDELVIDAVRSVFGPGLYNGAAGALGLALLDSDWRRAAAVFVILFTLGLLRLFRQAITIFATILLVWGGLHATAGAPTPSQVSRALNQAASPAAER